MRLSIASMILACRACVSSASHPISHASAGCHLKLLLATLLACVFASSRCALQNVGSGGRRLKKHTSSPPSRSLPTSPSSCSARCRGTRPRLPRRPLPLRGLAARSQSCSRRCARSRCVPLPSSCGCGRCGRSSVPCSALRRVCSWRPVAKAWAHSPAQQICRRCGHRSRRRRKGAATARRWCGTCTTPPPCRCSCSASAAPHCCPRRRRSRRPQRCSPACSR